MPTDENVSKLIINYLTLQQYQSITPNEGELYFVSNEVDALPGQSASDIGKALTANGDGTVKWSDFPSLTEPHTWLGEQRFVTVATDEIKSTAGSYLVRFEKEENTDDRFRTVIGSTSWPTTICGGAPRLFYAAYGEGYEQNAIAFISDIPVLIPKTVQITMTLTGSEPHDVISLVLQGNAVNDVEITDVASLSNAFGGAVVGCSGAYLHGDAQIGTPLYVDIGARSVHYLYWQTQRMAEVSLEGAFDHIEVMELKGN